MSETSWAADDAGHPQAQLTYAWTYKDDEGILQHVAVLGVPPINSAQDAVKASVMAHIEKRRNKREGT